MRRYAQGRGCRIVRRRGALAGALAMIGLLAAGAGPVLARDSAGPVSARPVSYAELDRLPDWRGVWIPMAPPFFMGPPAPVMKGVYKQRFDRVIAELEKGNSNPVETRASGCEPPAMPTVMIQPYNLEFLFTPGRVTIVQEAYMQVRRVFTDGRPLPEDPDPTFNGSSIGRWEGDTLVVTTVGLKEGKNLGYVGAVNSDRLRITERIHLARDNPDHLIVDFAFEDAEALVEPWHRSVTFQRHREWEQAEFVCAENDRNPFDSKGEPQFVPPVD